MKKISSLVAIILIMLFALTGCVKVNYDVTINKDGSADISYVYGFKKEYLEESEISTQDMTQDMKANAEENGYEIEEYSDDEISGFKASKHLKEVSEFSLQEAFGENYIEDIEENKIKVEKKAGKTIYSQQAKIDLTTSMSGMESFVEMQYTVKLPIAVGDNNANEVSKDGKTLTWDLKAGEITEINFEASSGGTMVLIIIIVAIIAVIAVAAIIIIKMAKSKKHNVEDTVEENKENKE